MTRKNWRRAVPLGCAALLLLSGCDEEEKKNPEVEVTIPKGVDVKVKRVDDEMVIVAELIALSGVIMWALFAPGARRRWPDAVPPLDTASPEPGGRSKHG